jgi:predicted small integral membrane protein
VASRAGVIPDDRHERIGFIAVAVKVDAKPDVTERHRAIFTGLGQAPWLVLAGLFVVALILRHVLPANTDVSWLLTVAERVWDGQRLYADVIETNPPMAVLTYIPGIAIAHGLGLPAETVTDSLVFVAIFASLAIVAYILKHSSILPSSTGWPLAWLAFAILAILPTKTFGQREHIAVVELLPALALYAVRMTGRTPPIPAILAAGFGAGLALSFKPHFAIGISCGLAAAAIYTRSWRILFTPENFIAAAMAAIYILCTVVFYPTYLSAIAPLVRDIYIAVGASPIEMIKTPAVPIWAAATFAAVVLKRSGRIDGPLLLLLATSFGFMVAFFLQRKGWPYHSYPMIAFAMLALGYALAMRTPRDRALGIFATATLAMAFIQSILWFNWAFDKAFDARPLWTSIARLGPHPKILAITAEPGLGHPLTRALEGTWVSRQQGLWVAAYLRNLRGGVSPSPQRQAVFEAYAARERAMLIEDIKKNEPTVVLIDNFSDNWSSWLRDNREIADLLVDYRLVATINDIEVRAKAH